MVVAASVAYSRSVSRRRSQIINAVLAIAAAEDLEAENVDVDTAFLYGEVDEEIYMDLKIKQTRRRSVYCRRRFTGPSKQHDSGTASYVST